MGPVDAFWHLSNLFLPALLLGALAAAMAKLVWRRELGSVLAVQLITASNSCRRLGMSESRIASPPKREARRSPRSSVRLASAMLFGVRAAKGVATSSIILPAPTTSTLN